MNEVHSGQAGKLWSRFVAWLQNTPYIALGVQNPVCHSLFRGHTSCPGGVLSTTWPLVRLAAHTVHLLIQPTCIDTKSTTTELLM